MAEKFNRATFTRKFLKNITRIKAPDEMLAEKRAIQGNEFLSKEDYLRMGKMYYGNLVHQLEYMDKAVNDMYRYCGMTWTEANKICTRLHEIGSVLTCYGEAIAKLMESDTNSEE